MIKKVLILIIINLLNTTIVFGKSNQSNIFFKFNIDTYLDKDSIKVKYKIIENPENNKYDTLFFIELVNFVNKPLNSIKVKTKKDVVFYKSDSIYRHYTYDKKNKIHFLDYSIEKIQSNNNIQIIKSIYDDNKGTYDFYIRKFKIIKDSTLSFIYPNFYIQNNDTLYKLSSYDKDSLGYLHGIYRNSIYDSISKNFKFKFHSGLLISFELIIDEVNKFILSYNVDKVNLNIIKQHYMSSKIDYEDSCLINNFDSKNLIPLFKMQFMPFPAGCESYSELIFNNTFDGEFTKGSSFIVYDIRKSEGKVQRIKSIKQ